MITPQEYLRDLRRRQSKPELRQFITDHFGVTLPNKSFTEGHSNPFAFVADAFFNPAQDMAVWSNRSGIKTLGASILLALEFAADDNLEVRVLSGSEDQAKNLYRYFLNWTAGPLKGRIEGDPAKLQTKVAGGSLEIFAASERRVRGPKVQRLYEDELDEIDSGIHEAAAGMMTSKGELPSRTIYTSTWHRTDGMMGTLVEGCPKNGVELHKWSVWESIEQCPLERHQEGRGCQACKLRVACVGKATEYFGADDPLPGIASEACGLYRIDDVIKAFLKVSAGTWAAEYECTRPAVEGLVYPAFDVSVHRCDRPPEGYLEIYRAIDFGITCFVCLWIGEAADGTAYILDTYRAEQGTLRQHAGAMLTHKLHGEVAATYCDPAGRNRNDQTGRSSIDELKRYGIHCKYTLRGDAREVRNGIRLVRAAIEPAGGKPKLYYVNQPGNHVFVRAMQSYRNRKVNQQWIDQPQDPQEYEHIPDALRYYYVNREMGSPWIERQWSATGA